MSILRGVLGLLLLAVIDAVTIGALVAAVHYGLRAVLS